MRFLTTLCGAGVLSCVIAQTVAAQATPATSTDALRALGLTIATSGSARDTLGVLVAAVTRDGPADQAGITTGNRIVAVNGQPTRLAADEIGRRSASDSAISRFVRAVRVISPTGDVSLKISGGGAIRTVAVPLGAFQPGTAGVPTASIAPGPSVRAVVPTSPPAQVVLVATPSAVPSAPPAAPVPVDSTTTRATPQAVPRRPTEAASPDTASRAVVLHAASRADESLPRIVEALAHIQLELRRVARESASLALGDSLADLEWQLSGIRRSLRALSGVSAAASPADSVSTGIDSTSVLARWLRAADRLDARASTSRAAAPRAAPPGTPSVTSGVAPRAATPAVPESAPAAAASPVTQAPTAIELVPVSGDLAAYLGPQGAAALVVVRATDAHEPLKAGDVILQADGIAPALDRLRTMLAAHARVSLLLLRRGRTFTVVVGDAAP